MCFQWTSKQRIRLNLPISALYLHFSVLPPFQRFIPISAFYPHFSVLSPFQRFIPISAFYPHFSVLSPFQRFIPISVSAFSFRFRDSVSAFYPYPKNNHFRNSQGYILLILQQFSTKLCNFTHFKMLFPAMVMACVLLVNITIVVKINLSRLIGRLLRPDIVHFH